MKIFVYETKRENCEVRYTVKAENKQEAIKKIEAISGDHGINVKEK